MSKYALDSKGLTLLELLVSLVLSSVIAIFAFSVMAKGIEHYKDIRVINSMRDEADYLMAMLNKEIYTTKESQIISLPDKDKNIKFFVIKRSEDSPPTKSGLVNNQIVIGDELIKVENESISITNKSYIQKADKSLYRIHLVLINEKKNKEMVFETLVPTINDLEEE